MFHPVLSSKTLLDILKLLLKDACPHMFTEDENSTPLLSNYLKYLTFHREKGSLNLGNLCCTEKDFYPLPRDKKKLLSETSFYYILKIYNDLLML